MDFVSWLLEQGCQVEITQEDDGSGYFLAEVTLPDGPQKVHKVTVETQ